MVHSRIEGFRSFFGVSQPFQVDPRCHRVRREVPTQNSIKESVLLGHDLHESGWLAILITAAQIAIGVWLIRVGPKPTIAYILFVILSTLMGSLVFNAPIRA